MLDLSPGNLDGCSSSIWLQITLDSARNLSFQTSRIWAVFANVLSPGLKCFALVSNCVRTSSLSLWCNLSLSSLLSRPLALTFPFPYFLASPPLLGPPSPELSLHFYPPAIFSSPSPSFNIYLFGCNRSLLQHVIYLVVVCGILYWQEGSDQESPPPGGCLLSSLV